MAVHFAKKLFATVHRFLSNATIEHNANQYKLLQISTKLQSVQSQISDFFRNGGKETDAQYRELYAYEQELTMQKEGIEAEDMLTSANLDNYQKLLDNNAKA